MARDPATPTAPSVYPVFPFHGFREAEPRLRALKRVDGWLSAQTQLREMPEHRDYYVYLMSNLGRTALYTGMTNNLCRRVHEHRNAKGGAFTSRYRVRHLVWFEIHDNPASAIAREKQIKSCSRLYKEALIELGNPMWRDLSVEL